MQLEAKRLLTGSLDFSFFRHREFGGFDSPLYGGAGAFSNHATSHPGLSISADTDLHNRDDLLRMLGAGVASSAPDDNELLLAAYAKWGEQCANYLLGEFAFAIWDDQLQRLFCCRDHMGFRAFLYWRSDTRFVFANSVQGILAFPGVPRQLNRRKLASLAIPTGHLVRHEETFHEGILSLPPGSWMIVEQKGVRRGKYWELQLDPEPVAPLRTSDAFEALREILFQAVECRLDKDYPVAALLSGGLDSSSVVAVAARCLEKKNRQLTAVSAILPDESLSRFSDERDYVEEFRSMPNVCIRYVTARGRGPFDSLNDPSRFVVFSFQSSRSFLALECEQAAAASGARCLLWGAEGELAATAWGQRYYVELAVRLRWLTLIKELSKRKAPWHVSSLRRLAGEFWNTLAPLRSWKPIVLLADDFKQRYRPMPAWRNHSLLQRQFQAAQIRLWLDKHAMERGQPLSLLRPSFPLADKRVLEFCLSLPAGMNMRDGYPRYLTRAALDGILPPRIQWRIGKTAFSPDYYVRYNAQLGMAREFVSAIGARDPVRSVIDVPRLEKLLVPVDPTKESKIARDDVPVTLYMICFLRQFSEFRP